MSGISEIIGSLPEPVAILLAGLAIIVLLVLLKYLLGLAWALVRIGCVVVVFLAIAVGVLWFFGLLG